MQRSDYPGEAAVLLVGRGGRDVADPADQGFLRLCEPFDVFDDTDLSK